MKKMYLLFSLALLLFGVNAAYAKLKLGEQKTSLKAGDKIFFQTCGSTTASWVANGWLYADTKEDASASVYLSKSATADLPPVHAGYTFELVDAETSFERFDKTYQGFYLYCPDLGKYAVSTGTKYYFKKNKERASVFYLINPKEYAALRGLDANYVEEHYPDALEALENAFELMVRVKSSGAGLGGDGYDYWTLSHAGTLVENVGAVDWGVWMYAFEALEEEDSAGDMLALVTTLQPLIANAEPGTYPGCVANAEALETLKAAYEAAIQEDADPEVVYQPLKEAYEAFKSYGDNGFIPLTDGYYYIRNGNTTFHDVSGSYRTMVANGITLTWQVEDPTDKTSVWQVISTKTPSRYVIRNVTTMTYLPRSTTRNAQAFATKDSIDISVVHYNLRPLFVIGENDPLYAISDNTGMNETGKVWGWPAIGDNTYSSWTFVPVTDLPEEDFVEGMAQLKRNDAYAKLLDTAMNTYRIALGFQPYTPEDNKLITYTPGEEEVSTSITYGSEGTWTGGTVSSNAKEAGEGNYGTLCDGKIENNSFFHSSWSKAVSDWHYLQFDLDEPIENVAFYWSRRIPEGTPRRLSQFDVQVCADTVGGGEWITVATINANYLISGDQMTVDGQVIEGNDEVISSAAPLFGSYKHIRMVAKQVMSRTVSDNVATYTANSGAVGGFPYFTAAEFNIMKVELDPDCQMNILKRNEEVAPLIEALEAEMARARQITEPTVEDMAALQKAYDEFAAVFPDPTPLTDLIASTEEYMSNMYVGGVPGTYESQELLDEKLLAVRNVIESAQADLDARTLYFKSEVDAHIAAIEEARQALSDGARPIDFTKWIRLYLTREYWAKNPDLVKPEGWIDNSAMYAPVSAESELSTVPFNAFNPDQADAFDWRFVPVKGGYFIQSRSTGKFIGESRSYESSYAWYPALSSVPAVFTVEPIGGGSFVIAGTTLDGGSVVEKSGYAAAHKYLHGAVAGQAVAYWQARDLGSRSGWEFEIQSADAFGESADADMENVSVQKRLVPNKLYTGCYPTDVTLSAENGIVNVYTVAGKNADESVVYLEKMAAESDNMVSIEAGTPFIYEVGEENSDFTQYVENKDEESLVDLVVYYDFYPTLNAEENDAMYASVPQKTAGLVGIFEDQIAFKGHGLVSVYEKGNAVVAYGEGLIEEDDESLETVLLRASAYVAPANVPVLGADEVAGKYILPIAGKVDNAIVPVVGDAVSSALVDVYTIDGIRVRTAVGKAEALKGLKSGLYIVNKQKVVVE